jgi:hypothetical protein
MIYTTFRKLHMSSIEPLDKKSIAKLTPTAVKIEIIMPVPAVSRMALSRPEMNAF